MGVKTVVTCDHCGADLTYTGNCEDWRLVLGNEPKTPDGNVLTSMAIWPPVDRKYVFCGLPHLVAWLASKAPR